AAKSARAFFSGSVPKNSNMDPPFPRTASAYGRREYPYRIKPLKRQTFREGRHVICGEIARGVAERVCPLAAAAGRAALALHDFLRYRLAGTVLKIKISVRRHL